MKTVGSTALLAILASLPAAANVGTEMEMLVNGDFETGDLTGWSFIPDANSDAGQMASVATFMGSSAFRVNPGREMGITAESGGVLSQPVSLVAGATYGVSAGLLAIQDVNSLPNDPFGNLDGGTITVSLDETVLHTLDVGQIEVDELITDSFSTQYVASVTGVVDFELRFSREFRSNTIPILHYADDLSIIQVPEPNSLIVLGSGLLAIAGQRRLARCWW